MTLEEMMGSPSTGFNFQNGNYSVSTEPFGDRADEKWWQVRVSQKRKRLIGGVQEREVAKVTLKEEGDTLHLMGNYNHSGKGGDRVSGIVGETIQQIVERTGLGLVVDGLTDEGIRLYDRLFNEHRETIEVERLGLGVYRISPSFNTYDIKNE